MTEASYPNPWIYKGKPFESEDIGKYYGFVYLITQLSTERKYIGRKYFWTHRKPKGKKRRVKAESEWRKYYGSNDVLKALVQSEGIADFSRVILAPYLTKGGVNYGEVKEQFERRVLEDDIYFNDQISGKWFKVRVQKYMKESEECS